MIWAGIIDHHIVGPFFFDTTVSRESYLNILGNEMLPELHMLNYSEENVVFQQDGAPAHFSTVVTTWLNENFGAWIGRGGTLKWPPRSPDLTPLDFFLWSFIKNKVYATPPTSLADLKQKIINAFTTVTVDMLENVQQTVMKRIEKCITVNGDHFEQLL